MLRHALDFQQSGRSFAGVIFAQPLRISVGGCIRDLQLLAEAGDPGDLDNQVVYLPL